MNDVNRKSNVWCVTIFPKIWDKEALDLLLCALAWSECTFISRGIEYTTSGRLHWHLYMRFAKKVYGHDVQRMLGEKAHVEVSTRGLWRAVQYVRKDGDFKEWGVMPVIRNRAVKPTSYWV